MTQTFITDFHSIRPKYEKSQQESLSWLAAAHCQSEVNSDEAFTASLQERLNRVACKPGIINSRGHELPDFLNQNWHEMQVYSLNVNPKGASLAVRQEVHQKIVDDLFLRFYDGISLPPENILHVTCTGYASPSGAQKLIAKRGWEQKTHVTHLYHMGCYAAIAALRVADGMCSKSLRTDIVHTELCTLHHHPELHDAAQLVVQSLFADGFIKYALTTQPQNTHFRLLGAYEEIIPDSADLMQWHLSDTGFQFHLSKEIPVAIAKNLNAFVKRLCLRTNIAESKIKDALFAVHPGGPKILDYVQKWLALENEQLADSREILKNHGNMSSATLPHIWQRILERPANANLVISLAFGPGLTLAGAIFERGD